MALCVENFNANFKTGVEIFNSNSNSGVGIGVGVELFWVGVGVELNFYCEAGVGVGIGVELFWVGVGVWVELLELDPTLGCWTTNYAPFLIIMLV